MNTIKKRRDERGVALLLTIFGLLLLTAIVLSMMFSSDSETKIATNYRDKQSAIYAAMSGVQEARDRLQPLSGDLSGFATVPGPGPTQLPGAAGQVLYIINPKNGETVAPWALTVNGNPNPYFDKELCQEANIAAALGIAQGPAGVACTVIPAGKNWYAVYDNSKNATAWKLTDANGNAIPLDYKWVRVTLKADNSGLVYVAPAPAAANGTQVCWSNTPNEQLQLPAGSGTNCLGATTTSVACAAAGATPPCALTLNTGGTGYSLLSPPSVTFSGGGGNGATATASTVLKAGGIASSTLTNPGSGYTSVPTVSITNPGGGTGAVLTALVAGSPITGVNVSSGSNYCYPLGTNNLGVNFTPNPSGTGSSASATVNMTTQACISSITASTSCKSQKNSTLTMTSVPGGTGNGFSANITLDNKGAVSSTAITNVGSYTSVPVGTQNVSVSGCTIATTFTGGIQIQNISLASGGSYVSQPNAVVSGSNPTAPNATQPTLNAAWTKGANNGQITAIQVTTPGTGYSCLTAGCYTLSISGGGGSGATGNATSSSTVSVSGITLTNAGAGYTSVPTIVIGGPGSGASATASLTGAQKLMLGNVYTLTSLAVTQSGSQAMVQMEAGVTPPTAVKFQLGGALTINGANPNFSTPNSANLTINGNDANSCGETKGAALPAIGVADNFAQQCVVSGGTPNPSDPSEQCGNGLGKPNNYTGAQSAPDVQVVSGANQTGTALTQMVTDVQAEANAVTLPTPTGAFSICTNPSTCPTVTSLPTTTTTSSITVVNGNLSISGNPSGNGILVVTGNLTLSGNFTWNGLVLVLGNANATLNGGGNSAITGAMFVGNINGGTSSFTWNGGGTNQITYDHCLADDLINNLSPSPSSNPLQVLSTRTLEF